MEVEKKVEEYKKRKEEQVKKRDRSKQALRLLG